MKIEVNLEKKYFVGLILIGLIAIGIIGVVAYNSVPANPALFGHSVDEVNWNNSIQSNVTTTQFLKAATGMCIGIDCITSWPSDGGGVAGVSQIVAGNGIIINPIGGTGVVQINATATGGVSSQWITSGNNINYNAGNVSTINFMKVGGVCTGNNCTSNLKGIAVYKLNKYCGGSGEATFSSTCSSASCKYSNGLFKYDGYYRCTGTCAGIPSQTCTNTLVGYLVS
jgi:hypothetical protein